jgi:pyruvate/2-oxoglutarate dehydrogenase complex dihydrolipoamide dehydrogenase (E3) component
MTRSFDAIVIGGGQAGPALAGRLTAAGQTVAVVERKFLGGTCVNTGCMPTKALVASAKTAQMARRAADYGVVLQGPVAVDMARVSARAHTVTMNARNGLDAWVGGMTGCTLIRGQAAFVGPHEIEVNGERLTAPQIFINVGGRAVVPDFPGVHDVPYLDNTSIVALDVLPRHLVVVGGSYIGLEFAQMYRRFGAEVTVVEKGPRLVAREDEDVSQAIREILEGEGITVRTAAECISFKPHADGVEVGVDCKSGGAPPRGAPPHGTAAAAAT